jgi:predicted nucleotidyltransferase
MSGAELERLREAARDIMPRHGVVLAYLHGSQAAGRATPLSDLDVAIVTAEPLPPRERLRLELTLEYELAERCPGDFDVRSLNQAPLEAQGRVIQAGCPLYARDEPTRIDFETTVRDRYFDFLPVIRQHREAFFRRLRERDQS